jgi:hypothetical protein
MYAIESPEVWSKLTASVELLAKVKNTGTYEVYAGLQWSLTDRQHYESLVDSSQKYSHLAAVAMEGAARNMLPKEGVDTFFALVVKAVETRLEGFEFYIAMHGEIHSMIRDRKTLQESLSAVRKFE